MTLHRLLEVLKDSGSRCVRYKRSKMSSIGRGEPGQLRSSLLLLSCACKRFNFSRIWICFIFTAFPKFLMRFSSLSASDWRIIALCSSCSFPACWSWFFLSLCSLWSLSSLEHWCSRSIGYRSIDHLHRLKGLCFFAERLCYWSTLLQCHNFSCCLRCRCK